ncbi:hypothetical protein DPM19_09570 [Actinomadura craniellae]|uniref:Uncharacterized protein n=1 Tax=Actinomadura craniellae TaxID=2231787 RepID=A0A365H7H0_9ACTN|nr:hypothetical protein [Actinomadura craniellae]RAY14989.1 hypothetical protein DPM19_09570 [Actinomadura craniellae]
MTDDRQAELSRLLETANAELARAEHAIRAFAEEGPDGFIRWGFAQCEVIEARLALLGAPSMPPQPDRPPVPGEESVDSLFDLARHVARTLVLAAEQADDPADKFACLDAARYAGRLREALR